MTRATIVLLTLALGGCGYLGAGTWDDDPSNWSRAFDAAPPPPGAVVKHSRFTRFPRLTDVSECFFAFAPSAELSRALHADPSLVRLPAGDAEWDRSDATPEWFAPKPARAYEVYAVATEPQRAFRVFIDRLTREVYLTDRRL